MIAGLSWPAWLLLIVSIGLGLVIELAFYVSKKRHGDGAKNPRQGPE